MGKDDLEYVNIYSSIPRISDYIYGFGSFGIESNRVESGFLFLISIVIEISNNANLIFLFTSIISLSILTIVYFKVSPCSALSLLLYFVHFFIYRDMNQVRAALSCNILLLCILNKDKNFTKDCFFIFIASMFHVGSLLFLFFIIVRRFELTKNLVILFLSFSIAFGLIGFSSYIINILPGGSYITTKLINYSQSEIYGGNISIIDITNIKNIFLLLLFFIFSERLNKKYNIFNDIYWLVTLSCCWRIFFSDFAILAARGSTFFSITEPVAIAMLAFMDSKRQSLYTILVIVYAFFVLYLNINLKQIITDYNQILL